MDKKKRLVSLEKPYEGLYISHNMWREMYDFSPDAVLMVACIRVIRDESDYIRDYDQFLNSVQGGLEEMTYVCIV